MIDAVGPLRLASGCLTLSAVVEAVEADFGCLVFWCFAGVQGRDVRRGARRVLGPVRGSMAFLFENMVNLMASATRI